MEALYYWYYGQPALLVIHMKIYCKFKTIDKMSVNASIPKDMYRNQPVKALLSRT